MDAAKPFFRFNPGAYDRKGEFEISSEPCEICGRPCEWRYVGSVYTAFDVPVACARCLSDGRLAAWFADDDRLPQMHDCQMEDADPALYAEVMHRTPGFSTFNPFNWPVLDRKPLAFIGYGDDPTLWENPAVQAAMKEAWRELGDDHDGPTPYLLIFREIDGARFIAEIDFD